MGKEFLGTKGKWVANGLKIQVFPEDPMKTISICQVHGSPSEEEIIANAAIISAAPELLQACMADVVNDYNADGAFIGCKVVGLNKDVLGKFTDIDIALDFIEQLKQSAINSALNIK